MLFNTGRVVATPAAIRLAADNHVSLLDLLKRHVTGDWGELCREDEVANSIAVYQGTRILSSYKINEAGDKIWCITEANRSVTTFLLPDEY